MSMWEHSLWVTSTAYLVFLFLLLSFLCGFFTLFFGFLFRRHPVCTGLALLLSFSGCLLFLLDALDAGVET